MQGSAGECRGVQDKCFDYCMLAPFFWFGFGLRIKVFFVDGCGGAAAYEEGCLGTS